MHWVLGQEFVESIEYMNSLPDDAYIYLFSSRWPFRHENIKYLAAGTEGETRGEPYGEDSIEFDLTKVEPVVILMGEFQDRLPEIQAMYPGGEIIESDYRFRPTDPPAFIAYILPTQSQVSP